MAIKTTQIDGDMSLGRNIAMGGKATIAGSTQIGQDLVVKGWLDAPNIKAANKGVFTSLEALEAAYPEPQDGWFAGIGDSTPFTAYTGQDGSWVATGGTINITTDMTRYTEDIEQLQQDGLAMSEEVAQHTVAINNIKADTQELEDRTTYLSGSKPFTLSDVVLTSARIENSVIKTTGITSSYCIYSKQFTTDARLHLVKTENIGSYNANVFAIVNSLSEVESGASVNVVADGSNKGGFDVYVDIKAGQYLIGTLYNGSSATLTFSYRNKKYVKEELDGVAQSTVENTTVITNNITGFSGSKSLSTSAATTVATFEGGKIYAFSASTDVEYLGTITIRCMKNDEMVDRYFFKVGEVCVVNAYNFDSLVMRIDVANKPSIATVLTYTIQWKLPENIASLGKRVDFLEELVVPSDMATREGQTFDFTIGDASVYFFKAEKPSDGRSYAFVLDDDSDIDFQVRLHTDVRFPVQGLTIEDAIELTGGNVESVIAPNKINTLGLFIDSENISTSGTATLNVYDASNVLLKAQDIELSEGEEYCEYSVLSVNIAYNTTFKVELVGFSGNYKLLGTAYSFTVTPFVARHGINLMLDNYRKNRGEITNLELYILSEETTVGKRVKGRIVKFGVSGDKALIKAVTPIFSQGSVDGNFGANFPITLERFEDSEKEAVLAKLQAAGVKWVRLPLYVQYVLDGSKIESEYIEYCTTYLTMLFENTDANVLMNIGINTSTLPSPPTGMTVYEWYASVLTRLVTPLLTLAATYNREIVFESQNEANISASIPKEQCLSITQTTYNTLKGIDSDIKYIGSAIFYSNADNYVQWLVDNGYQDYIDGWNLHLYTDRESSYAKYNVALNTLSDYMSANKLPIWITEFGSTRYAKATGVTYTSDPALPTETTQNQCQVIAINILEALAFGIDKMFIYTSAIKQSFSTKEQADYRILNEDLSEKDTYLVFKNSVEQLEGAQVLEYLYDGLLHTLKYTKNGKQCYAMYSEVSHQIQVPFGYTCVDMYGENMSGSFVNVPSYDVIYLV